MKNVDELLATINLYNNAELETITARCEKLLNERKTAARNALRHELTENLQKVIEDILHNNFTISIDNTTKDCYDYDVCVTFDANDAYSIELK